MKTKIPPSNKKSIFTKKLILPIFLASTMVFSMFAIILSGSNDSEEEKGRFFEYGGYRFKNVGNIWTTTVNGREIALRYSPEILESLFEDLDLSKFETILGYKKVYLSISPGDSVELPLQEFYFNMKQFIPNLFLSCVKDGEGCEELPLKSCEDATEDFMVIILKEGSEEKLSLTVIDDCITLEGKERDLLILVDKIILQII